MNSSDLSHLDDASNPHVTRAYYERLYPFKQMYQFYNGDIVPTRQFTNREFAFTVKDDIYLRYLSFSTWDDWKKETLRLNPSRFEIGAVYTARPRDKKSLAPSAFKTKERELVFDIDMTDYDDIRTCAAGKDICQQCWGFVVAAMRVLDTVLRQDFGYKHLLWVFSGRRGIHCWVSDPAARALTDEQRKALVGYIEVVRGGAHQAKKVHISQNLPKGAPWHPALTRSYEDLQACFKDTVLEQQDAFRDDAGWRTLLTLLPDPVIAKELTDRWTAQPGLNSHRKFDMVRASIKKSTVAEHIWNSALREVVLQYVYPRIDTEVSKHQNHLLKAPFCIHPGTGKVCVPVDVSHAEDFDPSRVPTIGQLLRELESLPAVAGADTALDWSKTSLAPYITMLEKESEQIMAETRRVKREANSHINEIDYSSQQHKMNKMSNTQGNQGTQSTHAEQTAEVGWQFVTQYYNFVNSKPDSLHYFYNQDSTLIHGYEDGDERTCFGQKDINARVAEIGFENCKVFVHSLDSQSSANGGILVQVVGEMSNRNGPWRKFAQTFFLAKQQSGYFVLNDIFRYLRDDDEVDEDKQVEESNDVGSYPIQSPKAASPAPAAIASPTPPAEPVDDRSEKVDDKLDDRKDVAATAATSSVHSAVQSPERAANAPKTWANLAAANSKKWGQLSQDKTSPSPSLQPATASSTVTSPRTTRADPAKPPTPAQQNVQSVSHALCFVKNVTDQVQEPELRSILQAKFGLIRDVDVVRNKACAFVQFDKIESAKKAIIASHSKEQGGEGGVKIAAQTVQLESRKEKTKNKQQQRKNTGRPRDAGSLSIGIRPGASSGSTSNNISNSISSNTSISMEDYRSSFFFKLERELEKINGFYLAKESELKIRIQILIDKKRHSKRSSHVALDEGFQHLERQLVALQAYVDINATGFRKILKKWDKRSKSNTKELYLARQVDVQPVFNREVLAELSNVVATNLIDLENAQDPDQHTENMSIDSYSDVENMVIKLLKKGNTAGLMSLLQNHKGLRLTWECLVYAAREDEMDALTQLAQIEWSYVDDINNRTCLHKAAIVGNLALVRLALQHAVDPSSLDIFGRNSIHYAALNGHDVVLDHLLHLNSIDSRRADYDGYTPSLYTIVNGHDECLRLLVSQLSSPAPSSLHPLCLAAQYGHQSIVRTLLQLSKDDIGPNAEGLFAHHLAARGGHADICRLLAKEGGEKQGGLHIQDKYSAWTPLMHAADGGHLECVNVLLSFGCDEWVVDENDNTAVFYAAWNGHMECVDALMRAKVASGEDARVVAGSTAKTEVSDIEQQRQGGDMDEIPTLALPPPMMPLRIYGHNYLLKRSLLKVVLPPLPIRLSENGSGDELRWSSLKLIVMQKPDTLNAPHHLILPLQKQSGESHTHTHTHTHTHSHTEFTFQMEDGREHSLDFAIYPGFGSVVMGRAVALPEVLMRPCVQRHTLAMLDSRLHTVGRIAFSTFLVTPYAGLEAESANVNAYWKSTTNVSGAHAHTHEKEKEKADKAGTGKRDSPMLSPNYQSGDNDNDNDGDGQGDGGATVITSSSLPDTFARVRVCSSKDGRAVVAQADNLSLLLPLALPGAQVKDFSLNDLCTLAREYQVDAEGMGSEAKLTALEELLRILDTKTHILLDIRNETAGNTNKLVDDILNHSYRTASSSTRHIAFVTADTEIAVCLQWKQPHFPVFLGLGCNGSVKEAVKLIRANNLLGMFVDGRLLSKVPKLVDAVRETGSMVVADEADGAGESVAVDGVDGVARRKTFNCMTTFGVANRKQSQFKPNDSLHVPADGFIYAVMMDCGLSKHELPFSNHVDLHSFNRETEQKRVSRSVRDVILAYAIPSLYSQVSNNVKTTADALRALDGGNYTTAIGLVNSPGFLHTQISLTKHSDKLMSVLHTQPATDTQLTRSSRVIAFVRTSKDAQSILSNAASQRTYVNALATKSVSAAINYINVLSSDTTSVNSLSRRTLLEEVLSVSLLPHPVARLVDQLSKLSLSDSDVDVIRSFAAGTSLLTSPNVSPSSIAAAHDLLLVRYIQAGQIPDAIKLNKGALSVVLSHGIGSVKRGQLIAEAWSVLPRVQKDLVEREIGGVDEVEGASEEKKTEDERVRDHENGHDDEDIMVEQEVVEKSDTKQIGSWIDLRLEQENKAPGTPFAPLQRKAAAPAPLPLPQSPLSGPPKFSTPTAPASTPLRNVQSKHKVAESPFAQLLGKSIAKEKERKEKDIGERGEVLNRSAFEIPSVTEIAERSLSTPAKHSTLSTSASKGASRSAQRIRTPEIGNESKDKITDLPDVNALQSVRKTRSVMPTPKKEREMDMEQDDDDVDVPGSYPYTPQPVKQQPRRNLRSTTLRSSNRRSSLKRNSDDVQMDESDDDDIALPGSYVPTPQPARGRGRTSTGAPKRTTRRTSNLGGDSAGASGNSTANSNANATAAPSKRQTRSSSRLNN
ncbi:hypothetical protein E3P77_00133 [Wallemia ichthyophaga]|nr:hypothetical protein E3P77_00133 [Wallemia ichthyophaga]